MKTSIDLPEKIYRQAKAKAARLKTTLKAVLLTALGKGLNPPPKKDSGPHFELDELGIPILTRSKRDSKVVTEEFLNQLREQEGV